VRIETTRVAPHWLELREGADAAARAWELVRHLRRRLPARDGLVIHDLACGSGSMGRWLAPLLDGPQHWVLHDHDPDLLELAEDDPPARSADGEAVVVETRLSDVAELSPDDLAGASLVTASALLDLLSGSELESLIHVCRGAGCPVLLTLSVTGRVQLLPADPLDARLAAAFNAHQRRSTGRGRLLGPDAVEATVEGFRRLGADVLVAPSPWRLDRADAELTAEWLDGWVDAACEQDRRLAADAEPYREQRLGEVRSGRLTVFVGHADVLVLP
jgi:hypothetical protein